MKTLSIAAQGQAGFGRGVGDSLSLSLSLSSNNCAYLHQCMGGALCLSLTL